MAVRHPIVPNGLVITGKGAMPAMYAPIFNEQTGKTDLWLLASPGLETDIIPDNIAISFDVEEEITLIVSDVDPLKSKEDRDAAAKLLEGQAGPIIPTKHNYVDQSGHVVGMRWYLDDFTKK